MSSYHDKCVPPEWTQTQSEYLLASLELYIEVVNLVHAQFEFFLSESKKNINWRTSQFGPKSVFRA